MGDLAVFRLYIDFDNNQTFSTDENVAEYLMDFDIERGMSDIISAGVLQFTLHNCDGRFIPRGSVYGNKFTIGRRVKLTAATATEPETEIPLFYGFIANITPELDAEEPLKKTVVEAYDLLRLLSVRNIETGTLTDKTTGQLINAVLNTLGASSPGYFTIGVSYLDVDTILAGSGAGWRAVDDGTMTIPFCSFNSACTDAIQQIVDAEYGHFYIRTDGYSVFESRHHQLIDRESKFTFTDDYISSLVVEYDDESLFNNVAVIAHPRRVVTAGTICFQEVEDKGGSYKITPGGTATYKLT